VITLIGTAAGERRIEAQLPWEKDTVPDFDDRQGLDTYFGCNHLFGDSTGGYHPLSTPLCSSGVVGEACSQKYLETIS